MPRVGYVEEVFQCGHDLKLRIGVRGTSGTYLHHDFFGGAFVFGPSAEELVHLFCYALTTCGLGLGDACLHEQLEKVTQLLISQQGLTVPKTVEDSSLHQDQWLDNQDLSQLLHVSVRSLQRYRSEGILPYKMMHKKAYYTKEGVMDFLNKHVVSYDQEEIALITSQKGNTSRININGHRLFVNGKEFIR